MPVRASSSRPSGTLTLLKNGGPTEILVPRTASDRIGKRVPHRTEKAMPTKSRLLKRKAASRLTMLSRATSASSLSQRVYSSVKDRMPAASRKPRKKYPTLDWVKLCTLAMMPLRVMKVPKMLSRNDPMIRVMFQRLSMPRFSWIITECRNADIVSHGSRLAFSTGSQAQ